MSNHHLRNKELSLKAKGLLSQMLSLPEDWDYTLAGLSHINREKIDAIREAVKELEKAGYIVRSRERDENTIRSYLSALKLDASQLAKLNKLRILAKRKPIDSENLNLKNSHNGMTKETKKTV